MLVKWPHDVTQQDLQSIAYQHYPSKYSTRQKCEPWLTPDVFNANISRWAHYLCAWMSNQWFKFRLANMWVRNCYPLYDHCHIYLCSFLWGLWHHNQLSRAEISNYIPQYSVSLTLQVLKLKYTGQTMAISGLILGLCPANERRCYKVMPSVIGWAQT